MTLSQDITDIHGDYLQRGCHILRAFLRGALSIAQEALQKIPLSALEQTGHVNDAVSDTLQVDVNIPDPL